MDEITSFNDISNNYRRRWHELQRKPKPLNLADDFKEELVKIKI